MRPRSPCAEAFYFPFQFDTGIFLDAGTHRLAERFDIGRGRVAEIDQEIAVHLRNLRFADAQSAAARGIDELPGFLSRRILECGAASAALDRLRRLARLRDLLHLGRDDRRITAFSGEE